MWKKFKFSQNKQKQNPAKYNYIQKKAENTFLHMQKMVYPNPKI